MLPLARDGAADGWEVEMDSFLVQVWVPADDASYGAQLRGVVRHVATGRETPFRNDEEVLGVLRRATGSRPLMPPSPAHTTHSHVNGGVDR